MKISLTAIEEIPKNSAIPPQTPTIDRFVADFVNFFCKVTPPLVSFITRRHYRYD